MAGAAGTMRGTRQASPFAQIEPFIAGIATRYGALLAIGIIAGIALSVSVIGSIMADALEFQGIEAVGRGAGDVAAAFAIGYEAWQTGLAEEGVSRCAQQAVSYSLVALVAYALAGHQHVASVASSTIAGTGAGPAVFSSLAAKHAVPSTVHVVSHWTFQADQAAISVGYAALAQIDLLRAH